MTKAVEFSEGSPPILKANMLNSRAKKLSVSFGIILVVIAIFSWLSLAPSPSVTREDAPNKEFSAQRAFRYVKRMTQNPRRLGSSAHENSKIFLMNELSTLGCELVIQKTYSATSFRYGVFAGPVENILCFFRGEKEESVLLMSHYDSVHMSPGAGDAASGVAIALETARALKEDKHRNSLLLLFTDGEESGLLGAAAFVKSELHKKYKVKTLLNFEARGNSGPFALFETHHFTALNSKATQAIPQPIGNSFMDFLYQFLPNETDMSVFKSLDISAMNFAFARGLEHYHKSSDTPENLSLQSLQHAGDSALHAVNFLLNTSLEEISSQPRVLYQDLFGKFHLSYPPLLIKIVSALLVILLLAYLFVAKPNILKLSLALLFSLSFIAFALLITSQVHKILFQVWTSSSVIIDFYFFFLAFSLTILIPLHYLFLKMKLKYPIIHYSLSLCLIALLVLSFFSVELGSLIVWSSIGVCLYCVRGSIVTRMLALVPMAIFLPEFLHSALIADSGTQFVLPAFVLIFIALLLNILFGNPYRKESHPAQEIDAGIFRAVFHGGTFITGIILFAFLGIKYGFDNRQIKRAEFFEILSEDKLYVGLSKSLKIETLFKQELDPLKKEFLLSQLQRWRIYPPAFNVFETDATLVRSPTTLFTQFGNGVEPYNYILDIPAQDYECVHILLDPETPITELKINGQSPYYVTRKKFASKDPAGPDFIESCSLKNVPLRLEFKSSPDKAPIRELLGIFTQNSSAPKELGLDPQSTIMSFFSNTLYVLKKIAL